MSQFIPVNIHLFEGNEKKYLNECIDSTWVSSEGPFVKKFEDTFSNHVNRNYGIAVSSGTAALDIAIKALGISQGDEVIMPAFTIISPAISVINVGATPVLVDSEINTWNIDITQIEEKITSKTKAIIVVHTYGLPAHIEPILALAQKYNLFVIEDAAEMHGQEYYGKKCGSFGDISIFSFYANKNITTGEGGMILCDEESIAQKCRKFRNLAFEPNKPRFVHYETGWNYRMSNLQAALGLAQFEQLNNFVEKKREVGKFYQKELSFLKEKGFLLPLETTEYANNIYWIFGLVATSETEKNLIVDHLSKHQIATRPFFWPMHQQPVFDNLFNASFSFPVSEKLAKQGFYIPGGVGISKSQMLTVVEKIKLFYEQA